MLDKMDGVRKTTVWINDIMHSGLGNNMVKENAREHFYKSRKKKKT